jgi:hypothetical protein
MLQRLEVSRLRAGLVLGGLVVGLAACEPRLQPADCERLLDRYVELLGRARYPAASADHILRLQEQARARAPELADCTTRFTRRGYECAMRQAQNVDEMERCLL